MSDYILALENVSKRFGSVIALRRADGDGLPGMIGGVSADEIGGIATKHYPAGELGKGPIFVTFIYLK